MKIKAPFFIVHAPNGYVYLFGYAGKFVYGMVMKLVLQYVKM